jgi:hypothetical protein
VEIQAQLKRSNVLTTKDYKLWDFKVRHYC